MVLEQNWTRGTLVGGWCCHLCAIPASHFCSISWTLDLLNLPILNNSNQKLFLSIQPNTVNLSTTSVQHAKDNKSCCWPDVLTMNELMILSFMIIISMHWLAGHLNKDFCVMGCFSTVNGKWVISGSEDNRLYIWDLNTCQVVRKLTGHTRPVLSCDVHPSEQIIVSGSLDKNIKIWRWSLDG